MPSVQSWPSYATCTLLQTLYHDSFTMMDTQQWHSLYGHLDPERIQTWIFQHVSYGLTFTCFAPFSANAFGTKVLFPTSLLLLNWRILFSDYQDKMVIDFLSYGWPNNYTAPTHLVSSLHNHPSASQLASHVQDYYWHRVVLECYRWTICLSPLFRWLCLLSSPNSP